MSAPMTLRARAGAPIAQVRHALTDPQALRTWLAEHAEVDLPGRFAFWGRYTPEGQAPTQRPVYVDEHTLRFVWPLAGEDTTVELTLAEETPATTIVSVTQTHVPDWVEVVAEVNPRSVLATFWSLSIANLVDYVEGRELTPKCDFTAEGLTGEVVIDAPPDAVFRSLMEPERFGRWFGATMEVEPYVGGRWAMGGFGVDKDVDNSIATIIDLAPDRKVGLDWGNMTSTWELADSDGGTRLTFVHSGFDEGNPPYAGWLGWLGGISELRRFHELPHWRPIWFEHRIPGTPQHVLAASAR
ncbi:SRPBCC family protein [Actinokineospora diospyrosa]|uniref:Conserved protein YndB, AHSA1/START domain n=1 Tax=Actinokineospora diospyrosa TaxID=103728 RepID=A0ABT1IE88_9PSEU|nr:SRPBCC family protein [Actinokineospora diospyrosa]MCP2270944.1 putative conserved protein YndB, AHSA1/START domain [Actinokineospora diospyrosa]